MAVDREQLGEQLDGEDALTEDVVTTNKVTERGGSYTVAIPIDSARDLGIESGDHLLFVGEEGDDELRIQKTQTFLEKLDDR